MTCLPSTLLTGLWFRRPSVGRLPGGVPRPGAARAAPRPAGVGLADGRILRPTGPAG